MCRCEDTRLMKKGNKTPPKEHNNYPAINLSQTEILKIISKEFKTLTVKKLSWIKRIL